MNQPVRPANPGNPGLHPSTAMALGNLLHKLSGSAKQRKNGSTVRQEVLELIKEVEPGYRLPADVALEAYKKEVKAEREAEKAAERAERAKTRQIKARAKLVEELGEDVVKKIEEGPLKKYPHIELEDAAALYRAQEEPMRPTGAAPSAYKPGQIWEFPDIPGLLNDPDRAAQTAAYAVIDEMRAGRR